MANWIKGAIKLPGAFTAKARASGKSVAQMAADVASNPAHYSTRTKRQAALARTLRRMSRS